MWWHPRLRHTGSTAACSCLLSERKESELESDGCFSFIEEPHQNTEMWFKLILKQLTSSHSRGLNKCTGQRVWELIQSTHSTSAPAFLFSDPVQRRKVLVWSFSPRLSTKMKFLTASRLSDCDLDCRRQPPPPSAASADTPPGLSPPPTGSYRLDAAHQPVEEVKWNNQPGVTQLKV